MSIEKVEKALRTAVDELEGVCRTGPVKTVEALAHHALLRVLYMIVGRRSQALHPISGQPLVLHREAVKRLEGLGEYLDSHYFGWLQPELSPALPPQPALPPKLAQPAPGYYFQVLYYSGETTPGPTKFAYLPYDCVPVPVPPDDAYRTRAIHRMFERLTGWSSTRIIKYDLDKAYLPAGDGFVSVDAAAVVPAVAAIPPAADLTPRGSSVSSQWVNGGQLGQPLPDGDGWTKQVRLACWNDMPATVGFDSDGDVGIVDSVDYSIILTNAGAAALRDWLNEHLPKET